MKLLLDQNLSFRLIPLFESVFPGSKHVKDFGLTGDDDEAIWHLAGQEAFALVSKDSDFMHTSFLRGHPPKFIYVRAGNCPTTHIAELILSRAKTIEQFLSDPTEAMLLI